MLSVLLVYSTLLHVTENLKKLKKDKLHENSENNDTHVSICCYHIIGSCGIIW